MAAVCCEAETTRIKLSGQLCASKASWGTIFNFAPFKASEGEQFLLRAKQTSGKYLCARSEVYEPLFYSGDLDFMWLML